VNGLPAMAGGQSGDVLKSWGIEAERADGFLKAGGVVQG
jgi:hypothetical protein